MHGFSFTQFSEVAVPLFVAMGPLTVLPFFVSMTHNMDPFLAKQLLGRALLTAFCVAFGVVVLGQAMFRLLGVTVDDLRVGGGIILLILSIYDLIFTRERRKSSEMTADAGIVPLGTPLMVGPATLTTCLVLADTYGRLVVVAALLANLVVMGVVLYFARQLQSVIKPAVSKAFGKVMSLFMAAIAVAMLRAGVMAFIRAAR